MTRFKIIFFVLCLCLLQIQCAETSTESPPDESIDPTTTANNSPFANATFYVDTDSEAARQTDAWRVTQPDDAERLAQIASQPVAKWMGDWYDDIQATAASYMSTTTAAGALPVFVAYNIPNRDCGSYSAGGAPDFNAYLNWVEDFADGIGLEAAVVILEPDATGLTDCLTSEQKAARFAALSEAVAIFKSSGSTAVYIDAGNANWIGANDMAANLTEAGINDADGFALNVSNFYTTAENIAFGEDVSARLGGKHFVIDTSRNGNGSNGEWCNPMGRAIGTAPTTNTENELVDALLWIKPPGESDGNCNGGPDAGTWWLDYAMGLVE